jgi:hypothetical protein
MGPPERKPAFPAIEWTTVPASHRFATRHIQECNWFQAFEGGFDTSHLSFLHRGDTPGGPRPVPTHYETVKTDFGFISGSGRALADGHMLWTVNAMLMPFHKLISRGGQLENPIGAHAWVPIDDESCMIYSVEYRPERPLEAEEMERSRNGLYIHAETLPGSDRCVQNLDNDFLIDRELQASGKSFTGIKGFGMQDCGIQESMGRISDRTREHLGASDQHIIQLRRMMLRILKDMQAGIEPPGFDPLAYRVRSGGFTLPADTSFEKEAIERLRIDTAATAK